MIEFLMTDPWQPIGSFELASAASAWSAFSGWIELKKHIMPS
jgi:hypothetical protein